MKKKIALTLALTSSAYSKIEPYVGLHIGAENLKGDREDALKFYQDSYTHPKRLKEFGAILGIHTGIDKLIAQWAIGGEVEANLMSTKHTVRYRLLDTIVPVYKNYQQEFSHIGNIVVGIKLGRIVFSHCMAYLKPIVSFDYFRTKTSYMQGLGDMNIEVNSYRKTKKIVGGGLGIGVERRIGNFKVGTELRYIKHRSLQQSFNFNPVEHGNFKAKPKTIAATLRLSYCF